MDEIGQRPLINHLCSFVPHAIQNSSGYDIGIYQMSDFYFIASQTQFFCRWAKMYQKIYNLFSCIHLTRNATKKITLANIIQIVCIQLEFWDWNLFSTWKCLEDFIPSFSLVLQLVGLFFDNYIFQQFCYYEKNRIFLVF